MKKRYTKAQVEALVNHDGLLCKPPWRNKAEEMQYYSRYAERMLWAYLTPQDWQRLADLIDELRIPSKIKLATKELLRRR